MSFYDWQYVTGQIDVPYVTPEVRELAYACARGEPVPKINWDIFDARGNPLSASRDWEVIREQARKVLTGV